MLRVLEDGGVESLYCCDAAEMARFLKVGVEYGKVEQVGERSYKVIELSREEWEAATSNTTPQYSLRPCGDSKATAAAAPHGKQAWSGNEETGDAQKGHPGVWNAHPSGEASGGSEESDNAQKGHPGAWYAQNSGAALQSDEASVANEETVDARDGHPQSDESCLWWQASRAGDCNDEMRHPEGGGSGGEDRTAGGGSSGAAVGGGNSGGGPAGGGSTGGGGNRGGGSAAGGSTGGGGNRGGGSAAGGSTGGGGSPGGEADDGDEAQDELGAEDEAEDEVEDASQFDIHVVVILRGLRPGCGIVPDDAEEPRLLALSPVSELRMSASLSFHFKKEKRWDTVQMKVLVKGGFESSGKCVGLVGMRLGMLHDNLEIQFFPMDQSAPVVLLDTTPPPHDVVEVALKTQTSSSDKVQNLWGTRCRGMVGGKWSHVEGSLRLEGRYEHNGDSTRMNLDENASSSDKYVLPNSPFLVTQLHQHSSGKLAAIATHMKPKLKDMVGKEWKAVEPSPPQEIAEFFSHNFGLGWPAVLQVEGEYRCWGDKFHKYQMVMERFVGESKGDRGQILKSKQVYKATIRIDHSSSWQKLDFSHYLLHHQRKRLRRFPVVAEK